MKMEPIERSETSASNTQTPGRYPKEIVLHLQHGENSYLKSRNELFSKYRFLEMLLSMALKPFVHKATTKRKAHKPPSKLYSLTLHTSQPFVSNANEASKFHSDLYSAVTGKEVASTVLPPFSGALTVDTAEIEP
jgi:hypothetical protein